MRRALVLALAACAVWPAAAGAVMRDGFGIHVADAQALDARLSELTLQTAALPAPVKVRILLPDGYASHPQTHYPVLYLLHGTSGGAADWTAMGQAEQTTAGRPLIVIMPDIGLGGDGGGWCTDWWGTTPQGRPLWETFHIRELVPWVDANLRTIAARNGRAIAGLSQGGFCAMSYAARHPDMFSAALSYSGAPDIAYDTAAQALVTPIINATEVGLDQVAPNAMFGPRASEEINWAAHDPATLAGNLRATRLLLFTGNGAPGPLDPPLPNPGAAVIEAGAHTLTQLFHQRLSALGIPSVYDDYGAGTHTWPYWTRDLQQSIGPLMDDFAHPLPAPAQVTFTSADPSYGAYGWRVTLARDVRELSTLAQAGTSGFTLSGSGTATVLTPPAYVRGWRYAIRISGRTVIARAGRDRRLRVTVALGPSNTVQEFPLDGPPVGTTVYTKGVFITRVGR